MNFLVEIEVVLVIVFEVDFYDGRIIGFGIIFCFILI